MMHRNFARAVMRRHACALTCFVTLALRPWPAPAQPLVIPKIDAAPRLIDFASGEPSGAVGQMVRVGNLVQRTPVDGASVSERTDVYLGYDAQHLYAVFACFTHAGGARAHRVNRDRLPDDDDSVALHLDTFRDRRRLYGFQVNPAGVQVDGVYTEGQGWDLSFDAIWTADTLIQPDRYVVLITIPFSSIRFPEAVEHEWGVFVYRGIPRKGEEAFWPAYSTRYQSRIAHAAPLRGLRDIQAGHSAQVIPYATLRAAHRTNAVPAAPVDSFVNVRGGVDFKTVLRESLVLDLMANPDFSQVESDEPQTTINQRFEVFFPEKRPFFIENASYFDTPVPVLFTRRIRDPRVGARLTGKLGRYALGALVTDDVAAPAMGEEPASGSRELNTVFRVSRDMGAESQVGVIYVGRTGTAGGNHVGGIDGRLRINSNWTAATHALVSRGGMPEPGSGRGTALQAVVEGTGHHYAYQLAYLDIAPGFQASSGFLPRTDVRQLTQRSDLILRPARRVVAWGPGLTLTRTWDHGGTAALDTSARFDTKFELTQSTRVGAFHVLSEELLRMEDAPSLPQATTFTQRRTGASVRSAPVRGLAFSAEYATGTAINLDPAEGSPGLSASRSASITLSVRPTPSFTIDTDYLRTALADRASGRAIFSNEIVRSRWNYQITRRLSVRAIGRYDGVSADRRLSSLAPRRDLNIDLLVTYLLHPGTALYVGWNSDRQRVARERGEQVFIKMSYLLRF